MLLLLSFNWALFIHAFIFRGTPSDGSGVNTNNTSETSKVHEFSFVSYVYAFKDIYVINCQDNTNDLDNFIAHQLSEMPYFKIVNFYE